MRFFSRSVTRPIFWFAATLAFVMAVMPHPPRIPGDPSDKVLHIVAFLVMTGLATMAYPKTRLLLLGIALSAFGGVIELVQMMPVLHRDAEFLDWVADTGAVAVVALFAWLYRRVRR